MKISTVREFRENAAVMLRSREPIVVTRRGKLAGVLFPQPEVSLPVDFKRELFPRLSDEMARQLQTRKLSEEDVLGDFASWREERPANTPRR